MNNLPGGEILKVTQKYGVTDVRVFGSRARADFRGDSDLDLLVTVPSTMSLWELLTMEAELEELLAIKVEVVTKGNLKPYIRDRVLADAKRLVA